ncbi:MAG: endonuclease domain-containing protein [Alphaproteobacteria bacterium]|nr:endonuclease domain-containing protein [Alphaproteobacteria bacterium]
MRGHDRKSMAVPRARRLRRDSTDVERLLWGALRSRRFQAHKFRRQHPIGRYVVDFICLSHALIIELDGGQHALQLDRDARRTLFFEGQGYRVVRFWNNNVLENLEGVLTMILLELESRA